MYAKQLAKSAMIVVLALLLLYGSRYVHCATVPQNSTDAQALLDFRQAITSDPTGFLNSWNSRVDLCDWDGVHCSSGRVLMLKVGSKNLQGHISPSLGNLTFLEQLNLSGNSLSGQIPNLNGLRSLSVLVLSQNKLQELPPDALTNCSKLAYLDLSGNMLTGSIPHQIGYLPALVYLALQANNFTGVIPSSLGNLSHLIILSLSENQLEGNIPQELGNLSSLVELHLEENRLSGSIC